VKLGSLAGVRRRARGSNAFGRSSSARRSARGAGADAGAGVRALDESPFALAAATVQQHQHGEQQDHAAGGRQAERGVDRPSLRGGEQEAQPGAGEAQHAAAAPVGQEGGDREAQTRGAAQAVVAGGEVFLFRLFVLHQAEGQALAHDVVLLAAPGVEAECGEQQGAEDDQAHGYTSSLAILRSQKKPATSRPAP